MQKKHHHKWLPVSASWVHVTKRLKIKFIVNTHSHMSNQDWNKDLPFPYHLCQNHSSGCQVKGCPRVCCLCWDYCDLFRKHRVPVQSAIYLALLKGFKSNNISPEIHVRCSHKRMSRPSGFKTYYTPVSSFGSSRKLRRCWSYAKNSFFLFYCLQYSNTTYLLSNHKNTETIL